MIGGFRTRSEGLWVWAAVVLWTLGIACVLGFNLGRDLILSPDSGTYLACAKRLIAPDGSLFAYLSQPVCIPAPLSTLTPVALLALIQTFLPAHWQAVIHIGQTLLALVALGVALALVHRLAKTPQESRKAACVLGALTLCFTDLMLWPSYLLTDTLYALCTMMALDLACRISSWGMISPAKRIAYSLAALACLALIMTTRPVGMATLIGLALGLVLASSSLAARSPSRLVLASLIALLAAALAYATLIGVLSTLGDSSTLIAQVVRRASLGMVATGREAGWLTPSHEPLDLTRLYLLRWVHFFTPTAASYSFIHNAANSLLLGSFGLAIVLWVRGQLLLSLAQQKALVVCFCLISTVAGFHAATILDFDWRYRFPVLLPMMIFTSIIFSQLPQSQQHWLDCMRI
ncbi:MAG: hypothetical protein EBV34_10945 [Betaproteobacteria bacterium]|nr:hypothetical protein [Betaproteobacteria bacterium]NDD14201.1 hypothetical protein [Betaproteobacteria bacterium]